MNQTDNYCPYDITSDSSEFGLVSEQLDCAFGKLFVVRSERTTNVVTLFLHGVGGTWASWTPLLRAAKATSTELGDIIFVDVPGFGQSENKLGHLQAAVLGVELLRVIKTLGWDEVKLVGHSMGGFLALDIAAKQPERIKSVAVISGTYLSIVESVQHPFKTLVRQPGAAISYSSMVLLSKLGPLAGVLLRHSSNTRIYLKVLTKTFAHPELLKQSVLDSIAYNIRPKIFALAAQNGKNYRSVQEWSKIRVPFKALFGARDRLVPVTDMKRLEANLNNVQISCLADTGHFAHVERPIETLKWLYGE